MFTVSSFQLQTLAYMKMCNFKTSKYMLMDVPPIKYYLTPLLQCVHF